LHHNGCSGDSRDGDEKNNGEVAIKMKEMVVMMVVDMEVMVKWQ